MIDKKILRTELIEKRLAIAPDTAAASADSLAKHLEALIPADSKIAGYAAIRGEIAVKIKFTALPVVMEDSQILKFLEYSPDDSLISSKFGTSCPAPHVPEVIPDVLIVPMVGFDAKGNRLGYGGGYYDATIRHLRGINSKLLVIGVAYAVQEIDFLPVEAHDEKMDSVVTEIGMIK